MKVSDSKNVRQSLAATNSYSQLNRFITLFCLLVLLSSAVTLIRVDEVIPPIYLVPMIIMGFALKYAWDHHPRLFSHLVVFVATTAFLVGCSHFIAAGHEKNVRGIIDMLNAIKTDTSSNSANHASHRQAAVKASHSPDARASNGLNIFFIETNSTRQLLTNRELCAIESAARYNPNADVIVYTMNAKAELYAKSFNGTKGPELLDAYKNINMKRLVPVELLESTPLMQWWKYGNWSTSPYILAHLSDALRIALLWKYGGFYCDLDTITVKDLRPASLFAAVGHMVENNRDSMGNGVMTFEKGHPFLLGLMRSFNKAYKPLHWSNAGPLLVADEMRRYCQTPDIHKSLLIDQTTFDKLLAAEESKTAVPRWQNFGFTNDPKQFKECNVIIYPSVFFYPFNYGHERDSLYYKNGTVLVSKLINTYTIHIYGKLSTNYRVNIGDNNVYEYLTMTHCPLVYESVKNQNVPFLLE